MSKNAKATIQKGKILSFLPTGEYYFKEGLKAYHRRDYTKSRKYLERAFQLEPGEPMIACQLAIILTELGEYEESNRLLHMILEELDEEMTECHYLLANNYAHLGFFKDAYHHAKLYLEVDPDGDFAEDTEDLLELLSMESDDLEEELYEQDDLIMKQEQARELLESGYFEKAIELLHYVIEEYPEYWSAYNNLALAHFYLGEVEKAEDILKDVLVRNPGNLHALCNQLVFAYYQRETEKVEALLEGLQKIQPMLTEQQFKLGATFALVGEYEPAYCWLKKLYKHGFDGDAPFYYWLTYAAYYTDHESFARNIWKKVLELNPEKEGYEPWNDEKGPAPSYGKTSNSAFLKLESEHLEERLFSLFLISLSPKKGALLASVKTDHLTQAERHYLSFLNKGKHTWAKDAHEIANHLYRYYKPIGTEEVSLYLLWFSLFNELMKDRVELKNQKAWAAATDYIWNNGLRGVKVTQQEVADRYGLSSATVGKYVKLVNEYIE
jgi:tetratricopeptide (TPR) repeat protein